MYRYSATNPINHQGIVKLFHRCKEAVIFAKNNIEDFPDYEISIVRKTAGEKPDSQKSAGRYQER